MPDQCPSTTIDYLLYKLGIFLLENEYPEVVFKRIKRVKNAPLKTLCNRLGVEVHNGWRKIDMINAVLLNVGHPRFAETLMWCLDEDGQSFENPLTREHESELNLQRAIGVADRWYREYQAALDSFQHHGNIADLSDETDDAFEQFQ